MLSTFACGDAHSPVLCAGTADAVVALEESEVLRPGFLELLKPDGVVLLNRHRILPSGLEDAKYPPSARIDEALVGRTVIAFDAMAAARAMGDSAGRAENVIALGLLSTVQPFARIPLAHWHRALVAVSPGETARRGNMAAFAQGRGLAPGMGLPSR